MLYSVISDKFQFISQCSIENCWPKGWIIFDTIPSLCWLVFMSARSREERTSIEKMPLPDWPLYKSALHFLNWWVTKEGSAHGGWWHPRQVFWVLEESKWTKLWGSSQEATLLHDVCFRARLRVPAFLSREGVSLEWGKKPSCSCFSHGLYHRNKKQETEPFCKIMLND